MSRDRSKEAAPGLTWEDLSVGAPTIIALARRCCDSLANAHTEIGELSGEAMAILFCARQRGVIAIKANNDAFDSVDRRLAVHVETDLDSVIAFRSKNDPTLAVRFLDALTELCSAGLVMHQLFAEFSLTRRGFAAAQQVGESEVNEFVAEGQEVGRHEW